MELFKLKLLQILQQQANAKAVTTASPVHQLPIQTSTTLLEPPTTCVKQAITVITLCSQLVL